MNLNSEFSIGKDFSFVENILSNESILERNINIEHTVKNNTVENTVRNSLANENNLFNSKGSPLKFFKNK
jgi:hypothetical protein